MLCTEISVSLIYFQEIQYPSIRTAILSRNLRSPSSIESLLIWVFNAIFEHHSNHASWNCPQVNLVNYAQNADIITAEILNTLHSYNRDVSFVGVLENLIQRQFKPKMESKEELQVSEMSTPEAQQNAVPQKMTSEVKRIHKKYSKFIKHPDQHPEYINEWREFYLKYNQYLAPAAVVDKKYFNYIYDFRNYFKKYLEMCKHTEVLKQQEIEANKRSQQFLEAISDESEKDFDVKIVEKPVETVEVSSDEDDDDEDEQQPQAKKRKVKNIFLFYKIISLMTYISRSTRITSHFQSKECCDAFKLHIN